MIPPEDLQCLKTIALRGGCKGPVFVSSQTMGEMLGFPLADRIPAVERLGNAGVPHANDCA